MALLIGLVAAEIGAVRGGDEDVLERRHAAERLWNLVRAHQPEPAALRGRARRDVGAVEVDAAGSRRERPGQHAEQRRLAGAVGADDADRLVLAHRQVDVVEHHKRSEALVDSRCGEDRAVWQCIHDVRASAIRDVPDQRSCRATSLASTGTLGSVAFSVTT